MRSNGKGANCSMRTSSTSSTLRVARAWTSGKIWPLHKTTLRILSGATKLSWRLSLSLSLSRFSPSLSFSLSHCLSVSVSLNPIRIFAHLQDSNCFKAPVHRRPLPSIRVQELCGLKVLHERLRFALEHIDPVYRSRSVLLGKSEA